MPLTRADLRDAMIHFAKQLDAAPHGERASLVELARAGLGMSRQTFYRNLAAVGWTSGRKTRVDKGSTVVPNEHLAFYASAQRTSVRANGKVTMNMPTIVSIGAQNGLDPAASVSTIQRQLRQRGLDIRTQSRDASHVEMRSLHPNHVHQVDASLCLLYYMNGKQGLIRDNDELYKNKWWKLATIKLKVYRWVLTDHASGVIIPWYTEDAGENQYSLAEFLFFAWSRREPRPFHGVPKIIVWDKGSANQSHAVKGLLRALEVQDISHAVGNPRAKGQVECAQNIVEKEFESRLRLEPVNSVEELNEAAFAWSNAYNANAIPQQDTRIHRGPLHVARDQLWLKWKGDELRELPDVELCRALLAGKEETRKVAGALEIQYKHPASPESLRYDVRHLDGVSRDDVLTVQPMLYGDCAILVSTESYDGTRREWKLEPIRDYDEYGRRATAAVFGESFKSNPQTIAEATGKALDRVAYGEKSVEEIAKAKQKNATPFDGLVDAHSHLAKVEIPTYIPRRGSDITVPDRVSVDEAPLTLIRARKALVAILGRALNAEESRKVAAWFPDGVPEADLPQIATALRTGVTPFRQVGDKEATA